MKDSSYELCLTLGDIGTGLILSIMAIRVVFALWVLVTSGPSGFYEAFNRLWFRSLSPRVVVSFVTERMWCVFRLDLRCPVTSKKK